MGLTLSGLQPEPEPEKVEPVPEPEPEPGSYPVLIVSDPGDGQLEIRIIGTALLKPGRYNLQRVEDVAD